MILRHLRSRRLDRRVLDSWSRHCAGNFRRLDRLSNTLVRYAILQGRDVLANAAEPKSMRTLARVLYRQRVLPSDLHEAIGIYEHLASSSPGMLEPVDFGYLVDAYTCLGRREEARHWLAMQEGELATIDARSYLRANLLNPSVDGAGSATEWLREVNEPLVAYGLEPIRLRDCRSAAFFRLTAAATNQVPDGPLVSVLMPVHEATAATDVAIASVLAQSWRNLELIIVDDASGREARERLKSWEGRDPRLRIVFNDQNRGAYFARNTAYELARGEFVTVSDKDDWHHPRKIELHALHLIGNPGKVANISNWSRVDENLTFLVRYAPLQMSHPSLPSLFFRRQPVRDALGFWDNVRKGADGEFRTRLEHVFGERIRPFLPVPLAFSLMGGKNLTSRDFGLGYEHPDRSVYKHAYGHWHRRIPEKADGFLVRQPEARPFPIPVSFSPTPCSLAEFDVVLAFDLSAESPACESMRVEIQHALSDGLRTAVLHLPDLFRLVPRHRPPVDWLSDLILDFQVTRVSLADTLHCRLLVVATPNLLQFRPDSSCEIAPERVIIRADRAPPDASTGGYSPRAVATNARDMFGTRADWVPLSDSIRIELRRTLRRRDVDRNDWKGIRPLFGDRPRRNP